MPKVSKSSATMQEIPIGRVWEGTAGDYELAFLDLDEGSDMAAFLKGLPDDRCSSRHWGYVTKGKVSFVFPDRVEVFETGDAFYVEPGHTPASEPGTEYLLISPSHEIAAVNEAIQRNLAAMQGAEA